MGFSLSVLGKFFKVGLEPNVFTFTTLINGFLLENRVAEAAGIFNKMIVGGNCQPNVATYGTLVKGFCMKGNNSAAIQLLRKMEEGACKPNLVVYNTIIDSLCKDTLVDDALNLFSEMMCKGIAPNVISQNFSQQSLANETQLFSITKGSKTISAYLSHAKHLADQLAAINASVSNTDLVAYVLRGLSPDYQMFVTAILNFSPLPSFSDLHARLLAFEGQQPIATQMAPTPAPTAFLAAQPRGHRFRSGRPRDTPAHSSPASSSLFYTHGSSPTFPWTPRGSSNLGAPPTSRPPPQCWTCHQFGHIAAHCPQSRTFAGMHITCSSYMSTAQHTSPHTNPDPTLTAQPASHPYHLSSTIDPTSLCAIFFPATC
ncbi:pentatricopeptide repeat-containing protein At1g63400-like [Prunus avium]|uniref:Pentatricopeptide repeat-containing protein At1g63400-like n=1 Tax=Prunus avium TaxID=42229 RepID=A0A6P5S0U5_PRUAV|nr:pentatricopeptide repeat-containing protein At1g63400-like [Prunus avium]